MFKYILFLFFPSIIFAQLNFDFKVGFDSSNPISLSPVSSLNTFTMEISQDTVVSVPNLNENLYHLKNNLVDYYLYLEPKTDLTIEFKSSEIIAVNGTNSHFIIFFNEYMDLYYPIIDSDISFSEYNNIDQFEIYLYNRINNELFNFYRQHNYYTEFSSTSKMFFEKLIKYEYLNIMSSFLVKKQIESSITDDFQIVLNDNLNLDWIEWEVFEKSFLDQKFYSLPVFQNFIFNTSLLFSIDKYETSINDVKDFQLFSIFYFQFVFEHLSSQLVFNCIYKYVEKYVSFLDSSTFEYFIMFLKNQNVDENKIITLKKMFQEGHRSELETLIKDDSNDLLSYDFYMEDLDGQQSYLTDYKGKILYVDIWASWCGPCRKQFPHTEILKKKFTKRQLKKIEFIYISIDNDSKKWKNSIDALDIKGIHFISPSNLSNGAGTYFEAFSIPRYILIDKTGNILNKNAKRPSDQTLFDDLLELIN